jgi:hypothetical protein
MKLNEFIETEFLAGEKAHKESQKHLREEEKTAFVLRKKGIPSKGYDKLLRCHVEFITIQEILLRSNLARIDLLTD